MVKWIKRFEDVIVTTLLLLMIFVVGISTCELGWRIIKALMEPPIFFLDISRLFELFGFFMLVLIGLELIETLKAYYTNNSNKIAEVVILVAMIAVARKIITLDIKEVTGVTLIGISTMFAALSLGYYILKRCEKECCKFLH